MRRGGLMLREAKTRSDVNINYVYCLKTITFYISQLHMALGWYVYEIRVKMNRGALASGDDRRRAAVHYRHVMTTT